MEGLEYQSTIHDHTFRELPRIFDKNQISKIIETIRNTKGRYRNGMGEWIKTRNLAMVMTCYHLALRPKEVCVIKLTDIDLTSNVLHVPPEGNKLRRGRPVPIPPELLPYLASYLNFPRVQYWKFSPYLFPSLENKMISRYRFTEIFRDILKRAGIWNPPTRGRHGHYTLYSLRHTKATEVYNKVKKTPLVADILGHKNWNSSQVYIHLARLKDGRLEEMRHALST